LVCTCLSTCVYLTLDYLTIQQPLTTKQSFMKRLFLLGLVFTAGIGMVDAQTNHRELVRRIGPKEARLSRPGSTTPVHASTPASGYVKKTGAGNAVNATWGTQIGLTHYDLQSNSSSANRIKRDASGGVHATWIESCLPDAGTPAAPVFTDRGVGYNYLAPGSSTWSEGADGTCELPNAQGGQFGVFTARVGWPEMLVFDGSQKEMIIAHVSSPPRESHRTGYGSVAANPFSATAPITVDTVTGGDTWPRAVNVGSNVYMVASNNGDVNGIVGGIGYYRSTDEGATFQQIFLPGHDSTNYSLGFGGDAYAIHANGNTVAIVAGDATDPWTLWKSTDAGLTFTRTLIRHPFTLADTIMLDATTAAFVTNDAFHAVVVDNNGKVHAFAGLSMVGIDPATGEYDNTYYPISVAGIWYWNDAMAMDEAKLLVDDVDGPGYIGNGTYLTPSKAGPYGSGLISMPNAAVNSNNEVFVVYSAAMPGTSNTGDSLGQSFRDLYAIKIDASGTLQSLPKNIARDFEGSGATDFEEDVNPSVAHEIGADNLLHMLWQSDAEPGLYVRGDLDPAAGPNEIMYYGLDVAAQNWGMMVPLTSNAPVSEHFNSISAMPNPTTGVAQLNLDLKQGANVAVKVTNILGQEVMNVKSSFLNAGANTMNLDLSKQADGVYLYTVTTDGFSVTNRLVKQ
jgi:hypothetical protein